VTRIHSTAVALILALTIGCAAPETDGTPASSGDPSAKKESIGERYQRANSEVTKLLIESDRRQVDTRELRSRHTGITVGSVKDFEKATYEMEKLLVDLKKALGQ